MNVMIDLEWVSDENFSPLVTSLALVSKRPDGSYNIKTFHFPMKEQMENGAALGEDCVGNFWAYQPLFGQELSNSLLCDWTMAEVLEQVVDYLRDCGDYSLYGNNSVVDNAKLVWLIEKYGNKNEVQNGGTIPFYVHKCFATIKQLANAQGFSLTVPQKSLEESIEKGNDPYFSKVEPHNPAFDAYKQLKQLEYYLEVM